jgi:hypothetical protein
MNYEIIENNEETENKVAEKPSGNFKKFLIGSIVGTVIGIAGTIFVKKKFVKYDDDFDDDFDDFEDDDFEDSEKKDN